jgi:hypothetical protein
MSVFALSDIKHHQISKLTINTNKCFITSARLAQSVARETLNLKVVGSSPTSGFFLLFVLAHEGGVEGDVVC